MIIWGWNQYRDGGTVSFKVSYRYDWQKELCVDLRRQSQKPGQMTWFHPSDKQSVTLTTEEVTEFKQALLDFLARTCRAVDESFKAIVNYEVKNGIRDSEGRTKEAADSSGNEEVDEGSKENLSQEGTDNGPRQSESSEGTSTETTPSREA